MHCCDFLVLKILFLRSAFIRYGLLLRYSVICKLKNFLLPFVLVLRNSDRLKSAL